MNKQRPTESRVALNRKKHHGLKRVMAVFLIFLLAISLYAGYVWFRTRNAVNQVYDNGTKTAQGTFDGKKPFSVLLLGTDTGAFGRQEVRGNSDTMIIATVNPKQKKFTLMSIPRDTLAEMIGTKSFSVHKINAAYNIGGAKMAMKTTSALLNAPLKYYVVLNMGGLRKMVNGVGGVDVTPPLTFTFDGYSFTKGKKVHLNGSAALAYSRMRYEDPQGDYGRQERQRQVIISLIDHAASIHTLANLETILESAEKNIRTNLSFNSLVAIIKNYRGATQNQTSDYLHGAGALIGGSSYQVMKDSELQRVSNLLRTQLGLSKVSLANNETYQNSKNTSFSWTSGDPNQLYYIYDKTTDQLWNGYSN